MKFLTIIWIMRFLFKLLNGADKKKIAEDKMDESVRHPAEFGVR